MCKVKITIYCIVLMLLSGCANLPETEKIPAEKATIAPTKEPEEKATVTPIITEAAQESEVVTEAVQVAEPEPTATPLKEVVKRAASEQEIAAVTEKFAEVKAKAERLISSRPELSETVYDKNSIARMDEKIISFVSGYTFDTMTEQEITIEDVIADKELFWSSTKSALLQQMEEGVTDLSAKRYASDYKEILSDMDENTDQWYFYMDATGICFCFLEQTIYEYPVKLTISYSDLSGGIKEEYVPGKGPMIARMSCDNLVEPQEGVFVCLDAEIQGTSGYGGEGVCLTANSSEYQLYDEGYFFYYGYLMKRPDERIFLILCMDYASDDYNTVIFEVTDGVIQKCDSYPGACFTLMPGDFENIQLQVTMWILGVRTGVIDCKLTENGILEKKTEVFQISDTLMVQKKELPAIVDGEEVLLPIGTQIKLTGTNGRDIVYFVIEESGQKGEIHFDTDLEVYDGIPLIGNIEEYEYFDGLIYAG